MPSALLFILFSPLQCYCSLFLCVCVLTVVANTVKFPAWTSPGCSQLTNALTSKLEEEEKLKKKCFVFYEVDRDLCFVFFLMTNTM